MNVIKCSPRSSVGRSTLLSVVPSVDLPSPRTVGPLLGLQILGEEVVNVIVDRGDLGLDRGDGVLERQELGRGETEIIGSTGHPLFPTTSGVGVPGDQSLLDKVPLEESTVVSFRGLGLLVLDQEGSSRLDQLVDGFNRHVLHDRGSATVVGDGDLLRSNSR